jgi:hypothetical protein
MPSTADSQSPKRFHIHLHGPGSAEAVSVSLDASFEQAEDRLRELPQLYFEPDGSFVWSSPTHQIFGMLYDAAGRLQYAELRGHCNLSQWRQVLGAIAGDQWQDIAIMVLPERQWQELQTFERLFVFRAVDSE